MSDWLAWQEGLNPRSIDLGLERCRKALDALALDLEPVQVFTIAGTNGKGSCARASEVLALAAGRRVGCYTSPHLWRYNERIRVNGAAVPDSEILAAFQRVDAVRGELPLTYFEFGTLAAFCVFAAAGADLWVLEVGLGGRLDAVNLIDADVAVVTSVGLDHQAWLGEDREQIAGEKIAVARPGRPLLLGPGLPPGATRQARESGALVRVLGQDIQFDCRGKVSHSSTTPCLDGLTVAEGMVGENLALAVLAVQALGALPDADRMRATLAGLRLPGRCERRSFGDREEIYDVAHNLEAVEHLRQYVLSLPVLGRTVLIFAALDDKPIEEMSAALDTLADEWLLVPLEGPRALSVQKLRDRIRSSKPVQCAESMQEALALGRARAYRLVICGSFHTVAAAAECDDG